MTLEVMTYTDVRQHLKEAMDTVIEQHRALMVTRRGHEAVVMMSKEEYDSLMETFHLLRSPVNAARLLSSIAQVEAGDLLEMEPTDGKAQKRGRKKAG